MYDEIGISSLFGNGEAFKGGKIVLAFLYRQIFSGGIFLLLTNYLLNAEKTFDIIIL
jgi:hypothetical protein